MKVQIPASLDEAVTTLGGLDRLLTAKRWERAAIVAAFVTLSEGKGKRNVTSDISPVEFAALGIAGLTSKNTVAEYVRRWLEQRPAPRPGEKVDLDGLPEWSKPDPGTRYEPGTAGAVKRITDQPATVAKALEDPVFAEKVAEQASSVAKAVTGAAIDKADRARKDEWADKAKTSKAKQAKAKKDRHSARYIAADALIARARKAVIDVVGEIQGVAFTDEERELLAAEVTRLESVLSLVRLELTGTSGTDWDAALATLTEGGAA